jgi:hypothetical protein
MGEGQCEVSNTGANGVHSPMVRDIDMNKTRKPIIWIAIIIMSLCCTLLILPLIGVSSNIPQGSCSVRELLLDLSYFPKKTIMSTDEHDPDYGLAKASRTFINLSDDFDAGQYIEYHDSPFAAWRKYTYNYAIFKEDKYRGPWSIPEEITTKSKIADQYHFACSKDTTFGDQCFLTARYRRYYVFLRVNLSQGFTVKDIEPLLQTIDSRMSACINK